jgi:hypothetical protein
MARSTQLERRYAVVGAETRIKELEAEMAEILRLFPELKSRVPGSVAGAEPRKRKFSQEGKSAISEGMRKYWARRKAREAKAAKP